MSHSSSYKVSIVFGTRPEAIKLSPLILAFKSCKNVQVKVILTGQHHEMVYQVLNQFNIIADHDLKIMSKKQSLTHITIASLEGLSKEFLLNKPDIVIVQGDTSTAFAAALAAFYQKIPIGHVEAGLRTENLFDPYPEEANRRLITQIASIHFAPTKKSYKTLRELNVSGKIELTGNTVIDALLLMKDKVPNTPFKGPSWDKHKIILTTVHRRENWSGNIEKIAKGILLLLEKNKDIEFILPMHLNPIVRKPIRKYLENHPRVFLTEPLDYKTLVSVIKKSKLILTDSGGLQEEAPSLGKPVLVLRKTTERPEAIEAGTAKLIGTEAKRIYKEVNLLLHNNLIYSSMSKAINPFGDGNASTIIVDKCIEFLQK
tara:strand:+ start:389 stop:1507 length:1119 start_codon:yes stop_codon:yes gene_type:complete